MSRKTGRRKRLSLYDRGNTDCPICLTKFTRDQVFSGKTVTLEHVKALGGQARCLTCRNCNDRAGRGIDRIAGEYASSLARNRFGVTVDILGKRDTFMLSLDGKELTPAFAGFSKQDWRDLENSESPEFIMSVKVADPRARAASSLKAAYLAVFSLLGQPGGYSYIRSDALGLLRQQIMDPFQDGDIGKFVMKAPDDVSLKDIMLVSKPLPCWLLKIADHIVFLPLNGNNWICHPLEELRRLGGGQIVDIAGQASWPFPTFGAFGTVPVQLAGADPANSLVGFDIRGTLPNGRPLKGTCISHTGESATLLCPGSAIRRAGIDPT